MFFILCISSDSHGCYEGPLKEYALFGSFFALFFRWVNAWALNCNGISLLVTHFGRHTRTFKLPPVSHVQDCPRLLEWPPLLAYQIFIPRAWLRWMLLRVMRHAAFKIGCSLALLAAINLMGPVGITIGYAKIFYIFLLPLFHECSRKELRSFGARRVDLSRQCDNPWWRYATCQHAHASLLFPFVSVSSR